MIKIRTERDELLDAEKSTFIEIVCRSNKGTYKIGEQWDKADYYCPNCGKESVWSDDSDDYYLGCKYICSDCKVVFYLPIVVDAKKDDLKRANALG